MTRKTDKISIEPDHWEPGGETLGLVFAKGNNETVVRVTEEDLDELVRVVVERRDRALPPRNPAGFLENVTCGNCAEVFGTNFADEEIACPECEARRCPCCGTWFGEWQG